MEQPLPTPMPTDIPADVTLYDGNTMTASQWRQMTEPVTGYTEITKDDLGDRVVRMIRHTDNRQWVVTVDTRTNSWAYLIRPEPGDDTEHADHPVSLYWAYTVAATGADARITPGVDHTKVDLNGGASVVIARTSPDIWIVVVWHGYIMDLKHRNQQSSFYMTPVSANSATVALNQIRHYFDNLTPLSGADTTAIKTLWKQLEDAIYLP